MDSVFVCGNIATTTSSRYNHCCLTSYNYTYCLLGTMSLQPPTVLQSIFKMIEFSIQEANMTVNPELFPLFKKACVILNVS